MTSTGAATPVQSSNAATPCASSTSSPETTVAPARRAAAAVAVSGYGRSTSVWPGAHLDEHLVTLGRRVDDEVGAVDLRWPGAPARELPRMRKRLHERRRRASVADHDRALRQAARRGSPRRSSQPSIRPSRTTSVFTDGSVGLAERGDRQLVRRRHARTGEPERRESAYRLLEPLGRRRKRDVRPVEPERSEGGVVHARRERLLDRPADDPDELRRARDLSSRRSRTPATSGRTPTRSP